MIKTIIIDDNLRARKAVSSILMKHCTNVRVVAEADSVKSGIESIKQHNPDLVLLDIQLSDGTGFTLLENLRDFHFKVVFITAYEEYAVRAIRLSALDYIVKPINPFELISAIQKATEALTQGQLNLKLNALLDNRQKDEKRIILKTVDSLFVAKVREITRCQANGNYTSIHFNNGTKLLVSKTLKEFDEILCHYNFFRVHIAHLISLSYIERCEKEKDGFLFMKDGTSIPVARNRKQPLFEILQQL